MLQSASAWVALARSSAVADELATLDILESSVRGTSIKTGPFKFCGNVPSRDLATVLAAAHACTKLVAVRVHYRELDEILVSSLAELLSRNAKLEWFDLIHNAYSPFTNLLAKSLGSNTTLKQLRLSHIGHSDDLLKALSQNPRKTPLRVLSVREPIEAFSAICRLVHRGVAADEFGLELLSSGYSNDVLPHIGMMRLFEAMQHGRRITGLNLDTNHFSSADYKEIARGIRRAETLKQLRLGHNWYLEVDDFSAIAMSLRESGHVTYFSTRVFVNNQDDVDYAAWSIANLMYSPSLTYVSVNLNDVRWQISQHGVKQLALALARNKVLKTLHIPHMIPTRGFTILTNILLTNDTLEDLNLGTSTMADNDVDNLTRGCTSALRRLSVNVSADSKSPVKRWLEFNVAANESSYAMAVVPNHYRVHYTPPTSIW